MLKPYSGCTATAGRVGGRARPGWEPALRSSSASPLGHTTGSRRFWKPILSLDFQIHGGQKQEQHIILLFLELQCTDVAKYPSKYFYVFYNKCTCQCPQEAQRGSSGSVPCVLMHTHTLTYKCFYVSPSVFVLTKRHFILAPPTLMCSPVDHSRLLLLNLYNPALHGLLFIYLVIQSQYTCRAYMESLLNQQLVPLWGATVQFSETFLLLQSYRHHIYPKLLRSATFPQLPTGKLFSIFVIQIDSSVIFCIPSEDPLTF